MYPYVYSICTYDMCIRLLCITFKVKLGDVCGQ